MAVGGGVSGWLLAQRISPRPRVRVAVADETGRVLNSYPATARVGGVEPGRPYALYLTDRAGRYRLLAFDLDASKGPVAEDLAQLRGWLRDASIPHLVARSGPSGGRHVWVGLGGGGVGAGVVAEVVRAMVRRLPTLDPSALLNPGTGCVRPPGAPHRAGGVSQLLDGELGVLTDPVTDEAQLRVLLEVIGPVSPAVRVVAGDGVATDVDGSGHRYVRGPRRSLPPRSQAGLTTPLMADEDASARAQGVLVGAARARWRHADIVSLVADAVSSPGLEHLRTARTGSRRVARSADEVAAVTARQWDRAVQFVARGIVDTDGGADETWPHRVAGVVAAVEAVQIRAGACPGRWARPGGAADRRALDQVCRLALAVVKVDVDLDIRSLAIGTGLSRETSRVALLRLAEDGWLHQVMPGVGAQAAVWALPAPEGAQEVVPQREAQVIDLRKVDHRRLSTVDLYLGRSHVAPPPGSEAHPQTRLPDRATFARQAWSHRLGERLALVCHDVFTGRSGAGHAAGRVFAELSMSGDGVTADDLAVRTGYRIAYVRVLLAVLAGLRLARPRRGGRTWQAGSRRHRTTAARQLGVHGVLAARARAIAVDRDVWAWWRAEVEWMHTPLADRPLYGRRGRRPGPGQAALPLPQLPATARERLGPYPRDVHGRGDHALARAAFTVAAGSLGRQQHVAVA